MAVLEIISSGQLLLLNAQIENESWTSASFSVIITLFRFSYFWIYVKTFIYLYILTNNIHYQNLPCINLSPTDKRTLNDVLWSSNNLEVSFCWSQSSSSNLACSMNVFCLYLENNKSRTRMLQIQTFPWDSCLFRSSVYCFIVDRIVLRNKRNYIKQIHLKRFHWFANRACIMDGCRKPTSNIAKCSFDNSSRFYSLCKI